MDGDDGEMGEETREDPRASQLVGRWTGGGACMSAISQAVGSHWKFLSKGMT